MAQLVFAIACLALLQMAFSYRIRHVDAKREYLAPVPSPAAQDAMAFGDREFLHRMFALEVQNAGDTGGRIVPVKNYDFSRVVGWLEVLERLDPKSMFAVGMADGYFGLSQEIKNVEPIVRFMMRDVALNPQDRWRFLYGAIYLARHRLHDNALALEAARQLAGYDFDGIDGWAAMTPAFILEDEGKYRDAMDVIRSMQERFKGRLKQDDEAWAESYLVFLAKVESGERRPRKPAW